MKKTLFWFPILATVLCNCQEMPSSPSDFELISRGAPEPVLSTVPLSLTAHEPPFVVLFDRDNPPADVDGLVSLAGGELLFWFPEVGIAVARADGPTFAETVSAKALVEAVGHTGMWRLSETQAFALETPEAPTAADLLFPDQWHIRRVGADQAWLEGATGSQNTVVAIIDTGIDASHPDLAPNLVSQDCMQLAGPCPLGTLLDWHGTHVAGLVAAAFDGGAVVGVGPNLGLADYQVFEEYDGGLVAWDGPLWYAILDAVGEGFEVINMSLGKYNLFAETDGFGAATWKAWNRVTNYALQSGVTVVAAAGNGGISLNGALFHLPGDLPGVINVAATGIQPYPLFPQDDYYDIQTGYTNTGAPITLAAPGGDCGLAEDCSGLSPSGYPGWLYLSLSTFPGGYAWTGGTSQAAPLVSGAVGLMMDENPRLNPRQIAAILMRTADRIGPRQLFGHGMLDVLGAVRAASR